MYRIKRTIIFFLLLVISPLYSQVENVIVDLQLINPGAQIFQVGNIGATGATTNFFILLLQNNNTTPVRLKLETKILLNGTEIATGQSTVFELPASSPLYSFTNIQLEQGVLINGAELHLSDFDVDLNVINDLENLVLATGVLPTGNYEFSVTGIIVDENNNPTGEVVNDDVPNHTLTITNPTTIELIFPGRSVSESEIMEIATTFPYFQWFSDVDPGAASYNIYVFEKFADDQTIQDVLSHPAILAITGYQSNFFQYPSDSNPTLLSGTAQGPIRLLEKGKVYLWKIDSVIPSGSGSIIMESDVFRFKVADLTQAANNSPQILAFLQQVLGPENEAVLQQLLDQGFDPNGTITIDGNDIEMNDLLPLLNQILQGELVIENAESFDVGN